MTERNQLFQGDSAGQLDPSFIQWASLAPVAVCVGNAAGQCIYANEHYCRLTGYPLKDMLETGWAKAVHPDDRERIFAGWRAHIERQGAYREEYRLLRADGAVRWVLAEITDVKNPAGELMGFFGVLTDITALKQLQADQRRLENELSETRRIESLAAMAGEVAHDFNNMLVGILGGASLALMELPMNSPLRDALQMIEQTALVASERTSQLLAFAGRTRAMLDSLNINGLIKNLAPVLEAQVGRRARVMFYLDPNLPEAPADASQIRHILINLVLNAAEAIADPGGEIIITSGALVASRDHWQGAAIRPADAGEGGYVFVEVRDNGAGMTDEIRRHIFTPFFSTKDHGRGLGLPAVAGIVRTHNGGLTLTTEPGRGTTIRAYLPCPAFTGGAEAGSPKAWMARPCVLVADDEETVRAVVRQILEREGYSVLMAGNGQEAIDLFIVHHEGLSAVLLDLTMPFVNGEQAFQRMQEINIDVPVILFSGYSEQDALSRFQDRGLAGFLQKPFRPQELLDRFKKAVRTSE